MKKTLLTLAVIALIAVLAVALVACIPSNPNKAVENLKDAGYSARKYETSLPQGCECYVVGTKINADITDSDTIYIYYFKNTDAAKSYYSSYKANWWDSIPDEAKADSVFERSGKIVYRGSEAAVKAVG